MNNKQVVEEYLGLADVKINASREWDIQVHDDRFYKRLLGSGSLGFGESYMDGWWDCKRLDVLSDKHHIAKLDEHKIILRKGTSVFYTYLYRREHKGDWVRFFGLLPRAGKPKKSYGREIPPNAAYFRIMLFAMNYPAPVLVDDIQARFLTSQEMARMQKALTPKKPRAKAKAVPEADLNA